MAVLRQLYITLLSVPVHYRPKVPLKTSSILQPVHLALQSVHVNRATSDSALTFPVVHPIVLLFPDLCSSSVLYIKAPSCPYFVNTLLNSLCLSDFPGRRSSIYKSNLISLYIRWSPCMYDKHLFYWCFSSRYREIILKCCIFRCFSRLLDFSDVAFTTL